MLFFTAILDSSIFVKFIVFVLITMGIWSWGLFAEKLGVLKVKKSMADTFYKEYSSGEMLDKIYNRLHAKEKIHAPNARLFFVGMKELTASNICNIDFSESYADNIKQNIRVRMQLAISVERATIISESKLGISSLASIAAIAPFIGLFGTAFGIMSTFDAAAKAVAASPQSMGLIESIFITSGIAQSMISIVCGIGISVPAVIFYNILTSKLNSLIIEYESFGNTLINTLSRELDVITSNSYAQKKQIK